MFEKLADLINETAPAPTAEAHCDAPCGVYDPASARIAAEAVLSMTKKIVALELPPPRAEGKIVGEGADAVPALIEALRNEAKAI